MDKKPSIGLTGGIASGKSTVARILEREGAAVVDADQIAREVVAKGSEGLREIVAAFGERVLAPDGSLAREKLGAIVFDDEQARKTLQSITHPHIGRRSAARMTELHASEALYVVYDAPLLVEVGAHKGFDALIVVAAEPLTQVVRAGERDGLDEEQVKDRIAAQLPLARKIEVADYVIHNDGTLRELEQQTLATHRSILQRFALSAREA